MKDEIYYIDMNAFEIGHAIGMNAGTAEQECWCATCELYEAMLHGEDHVVLNDTPNYVRFVYVRR